MEGRISMSKKELGRLEMLTKVHGKCCTIAEAAEALDLSTRQVKRLSKRLKLEGPKGLVSRKVGAPSNHRLSEGLKQQAVKLIFEKYRDFGPTLAHEHLVEEHAINISVSSIRALMIQNALWVPKQMRKKRVFQLRQRRAREGELVQVDGSDHDWFEGRGPRCSLLVYVDDATSKLKHLMFAESETVFAYFAATKEYLEKHGRPLAFYSDKHGVFRVNREEALSGNGMTQFGRAMQELDIKLICANTPQAKGRVERRNRDLQNRLIKAMRLRNLSTIEEANAFLPLFIEDFNKRFAKPPQDTANAHRSLLPAHELDRIFCVKQTRRLTKNLTLQYKNTIYQIITDRQVYALRKATVEVLEAEDGKVRVEYRGKLLTAVAYHQMQHRTPIISSKELSTLTLGSRQRYRPKRTHPWKRMPRRSLSIA
jgi:hypothetical protein